MSTKLIQVWFLAQKQRGSVVENNNNARIFFRNGFGLFDIRNKFAFTQYHECRSLLLFFNEEKEAKTHSRTCEPLKISGTQAVWCSGYFKFITILISIARTACGADRN